MDLKTVFQSLVFASEKHKDQRRKDVNETPYINHPIGVANILIESGIQDPIIIQAAILHDTIEDTNTSYEELIDKFGKLVADVVMEVSDDGNLPKLHRKQLQIKNAPNLSFRAKNIRLADKLYNLKDICRGVPVGWSKQRVQEYFLWAKQVIEGCSNTNPYIENKLKELFTNGMFEMEGSKYPVLP